MHGDPRFEDLIAVVLREVETCRSRDLSNIAWAVATIEFADRPLLAARGVQAQQLAASYQAQNLSNTAWAFSRLACKDEPLLNSIASSAIRRLREFLALNIANTSWSFAKLNVGHDGPLLASIASSAIPRITEFDIQGLSNIAWAFSRLAMPHIPLLDSISAESIPRCSLLANQNLANTAWAYAVLSYLHEPLMSSLSSAAIPRSSAGNFEAQELANTAWAFAAIYVTNHVQELARPAWALACLSLRHAPLMQALAAAALNLVRLRPSSDPEAAVALGTAAVAQAVVVEGTGAMLWSFWRADLWAMEWAGLAAMGDVADCGVLWMDLAWRRNTRHAYRAWLALEVVTGVSCLHGVPDTSNVPRYRKVASLVAHVASQAQPGSLSSLLATVETFAALSRGQWLKVAGLEKAEVICNTHSYTRGLALELGTFVGYTAARLAGLGHGAPVVTFEQDPIHVAVARWHLDHAAALPLVDVWPGRVVDSMPGLAEAAGMAASLFVFLDEGGSSFAADHAQLERLAVPSPTCRVVADNCLRPGAPVFAARSMASDACIASAWSLPEFLEQRLGVEDWMVVLLRMRQR